MYRCIFLCIGLIAVGCLKAQERERFKPQRNRILFLLDASGSMKEQWKQSNRFDLAKKVLFDIVDSIERVNPNVEFAVRAFGHQFSREQKNCTDSKLLIPFAKNNAQKIKMQIGNISPKGMTPIAYSIAQSANDFPVDSQSINSIILITDGDENCDGNPCGAATALVEKRITLKPFIVGIDILPELEKKFECVGTFYNPKDESGLFNTIGLIIKQTLNTTTSQVNLIDYKGNAGITNIPFTLYDNFSQKVMYNFVHCMDSKGNADTLYLDPRGKYDIEVHSTPPVRKNGIELNPGKHNIIAVDVPLGNLIYTGSPSTDVQAVIRNDRQIITTQNIAESKALLNGEYFSETTTLPEIFFNSTSVQGGSKRDMKVVSSATLALTVIEPVALTILEQSNDHIRAIKKLQLIESIVVKLQPGNYVLVYKTDKNPRAESTKSQSVTLEEGKYLSITLR